MMELYHSRELYRNGQYNELAAMMQQDEVVITFSEWDFCFVCEVVYKLRKYKEVLTLFKTMHAMYPDSDKLNDKV